MFNWIKNLFKKPTDKNREAMVDKFDGNFKPFDDMEQVVLLTRLSGFSRKEVAHMLDFSEERVEKLETSIINKMKDLK